MAKLYKLISTKKYCWINIYICIYTHTHIWHDAAAAKSLQLCPTLCNPIDGSPPGSPVPGILQARTLEWVAISFSNAWKWKVKVKSLSCVRLLATPWTAAYQAPSSMGFSRQEYWSGLPLPSPYMTWVWVNCGSWWWTGRPGVLQFMGSQRGGHDWATELNWTEEEEWGIYRKIFFISLELTV